jgi:hypothetical protein
MPKTEKEPPKRSSRYSRPNNMFRLERVVFEGHGEWRHPYPSIIVPCSTQITIYTSMGSAIDDEIGVRIARDEGLPSTITDKGYDADGDIDTSLRGPSTQLSGHRRTYRNPELVPNLILLPPTGLTVHGDSFTVDEPTSLEDLLTRYNGFDCHWAACTIRR